MKKSIQVLTIISVILLCFILFPSPVGEAEVYIEPTEVVIPTDAEPEEVEPYFPLTDEERRQLIRKILFKSTGINYE